MRFRSIVLHHASQMTTIDTSKMDKWIALRNSLGVAVALTIGIAIKQPILGLVIGLGAINVAFADSRDPYRQRLQRMLLSTGLCFLAVLLGSFSVYNIYAAGTLAVAWAFIAGLTVVLGTAVSDSFVISLTLFIICATQPVPFEKAFFLACLTAFGGAVQILLSVWMWSIHRFQPERRLLAGLFEELAVSTTITHQEDLAPFASSKLNEIHQAMATSLRSTHYLNQRCRFILAQAERIRINLHILLKLKKHRSDRLNTGESGQLLDSALRTLQAALNSIADLLREPGRGENLPELLRKLSEDGAKLLRPASMKSGHVDTVAHETVRRLAALSGQLRAVIDIGNSLDSTDAVLAVATSHRPPCSRYRAVLTTLRAQLNLRSVAFRHATRLGSGVAMGEWLSHYFKLERSYWIPMTIVLVLKPDYNATISRALLRILGTFVGILFSALLFHFLHMAVEVEILIAGLLMFLLRWVGTTNYGIFAFLIAMLVVFLFAIEGVAPASVMFARSLNTGIGGGVALILYLLWPSFERGSIVNSLADMLESYRLHFVQVAQHAALETDTRVPTDSVLDQTRLDSRLARANFEAAFARISKEPGSAQSDIEALSSIQVGCNRFVNSLMALDAYFSDPLTHLDAPRVRDFCLGAQTILETITDVLKSKNNKQLDERVDLRALFYNLLSEPGIPTSPLEIELDRMTNSLTTISEQVQHWVNQVKKH